MSARPRPRRAAGTLALLAGGLALLATSGRTWLRVPVTGVPGRSTVDVAGRTVSPALPALALVALAAAAVVLLATPRVAARVALVASLAGALAGAAVAAGLAQRGGAARDAVGRVTGVASGSVDAHSPATTVWPWLALLACLVVVTGGVLARLSGNAAETRRPAPEAPEHAVGPAATGSPSPGGSRGGPAALDPQHAWETLTRGEDPT